MTDTTYNGWRNYETWVVNLWLTNDEYSDTQLRDMAQEAWDSTDKDDTNEDREREAQGSLASTIQGWVEEMREEWAPNGATMFDDLINAAMNEVDWYEIAASHLEDVDKSSDEEDDDQ